MFHVQHVAEKAHELYGITPPQGAVLMILRQFGELPVTDLSIRLGVTKGSLSVLCKRMEHQGLVMRRRSEQDERFVYVSATPKGLKLIEEIGRCHEEYYQCYGDPVDDMEKIEILKGLCRLEGYVSAAAASYTAFLEQKQSDSCSQEQGGNKV